MKLKLLFVEREHKETSGASQTGTGMGSMEDLVMGREHQRNTGVKVVTDYLVRRKHRLLRFGESGASPNATQ